MANSISNSDISSEAVAEEAFRRVRGEIDALGEEDILHINLDIPSAVATAHGALPKLKGYREAFAEVGGGFDLERFDKLEDYTLALAFAHGECTVAADPTDDIKEIYEQALALRETLRSDLAALAHRGLVSKDRLDDLSGTAGHKNVAADLQALSSVLKGSWANIEGKTPIQKGDIELASRLSTRIYRVVGQREQAPSVSADTVALRARAYTLFVRAYDEARRALIYLRWHEGDADSIAPSLFAKRGRGKRKEDDEAPIADTVVSAVVPPANAAPSALPGGLVVPVGPPAAPADAKGKNGGVPPGGGPFA